MPMPVPCLGVGPRRRKEEAKRLKEAHESHWALLVVVSAVTKNAQIISNYHAPSFFPFFPH